MANIHSTDCVECGKEFEYGWDDIEEYEGDDQQIVEYVNCPYCNYPCVVNIY